jgi:hypothetical protein
MRALIGLCVVLLFITASTAAKADGPWRITKTEWTADDEKGFGDFVKKIAESGCTTTIECMKGPGNPYRDSDPKSLKFEADCAKWVYMLRAYYAWKNGLPFGYVDQIAGHGSDFRFNGAGNRTVSRHDLVDRGGGLPAVAILSEIHDHVSSASYRVDAAQPGAVISDFYSPKIQPGSIHAGTALYDINGHVAIVYDVESDGRVRYMSADPDMTVNRAVYGAQFGQGGVNLGGGFKNFRPLKLVGATLRNGAYVGGRIVLAADNEIPDFSLEQYQGTDGKGDGPDAMFQYRDAPVGLFEYVRGSLSGGTYIFDPIYELKAGMDALCQSFQERGKYVDAAIQAGIDKKPEPSALPGNIYASDNDEWEAYATPSRDASLKNSFAQLYVDIMKFIFRVRAKDWPATWDLQKKLQATYNEKAHACLISYTNSAGKTVSFDFKEATSRLFAMSFDPYQCIERRWGATSDEELATCKDDETKARWYKAEQNMRNQAERVYVPKARFSIAELEQNAPGTGARRPPPSDIAQLIDNISRGERMAAMEPVGF